MDQNLFDTITLSEAGKWFPTLHPVTGEPTDFEVQLAGPDSALYASVERRVLKARARRLRAEGEEAETGFTDSEQVELVAGCVLNWRGLTDNGQPNEFQPEKVRPFLEQFPVVRRQWHQRITNAAQFLRDVSGNSQAGEGGASG